MFWSLFVIVVVSSRLAFSWGCLRLPCFALCSLPRGSFSYLVLNTNTPLNFFVVGLFLVWFAFWVHSAWFGWFILGLVNLSCFGVWLLLLPCFLYVAPCSPLYLRLVWGGLQDPEAERNGPSKELMDRLRGEESGKDHFTYIVLTLRNQHIEVRETVYTDGAEGRKGGGEEGKKGREGGSDT